MTYCIGYRCTMVNAAESNIGLTLVIAVAVWRVLVCNSLNSTQLCEV